MVRSSVGSRLEHLPCTDEVCVVRVVAGEHSLNDVSGLEQNRDVDDYYNMSHHVTRVQNKTSSLEGIRESQPNSNLLLNITIKARIGSIWSMRGLDRAGALNFNLYLLRAYLFVYMR